MNPAALSYVALVARDPESVAAVFGDTLGMASVPVEVDGG